MNLDINITVENSNVTFTIRDLSIKETVKGIMMFNKKRDNILNVGSTEDEIRESIIGTLPINSDNSTSFVESTEMHKMFNDLLNMSYDQTVKLCKSDPIDGPNIIWEKLRGNLDFLFPFDLNNPDYTYMALFINYNLILMTEEKYKEDNFIKGLLRTYFQKYSFNIYFKEYTQLTESKKTILKKELSKALKRQIAIKELIINGDYI